MSAASPSQSYQISPDEKLAPSSVASMALGQDVPGTSLRATNRAHQSWLSERSTESTRSTRAVSCESRFALLPVDILLRIADFLEPVISPFNEDGNGGASLSHTWIQAPRDLINYTTTCRATWQAARFLADRHLLIGLFSEQPFHGDRANLSHVHQNVYKRLSGAWSTEHRESPCICQSSLTRRHALNIPRSLADDRHLFCPAVIRRLSLHAAHPEIFLSAHGYARYVPQAIRALTLLEVCSITFTTENSVTASSPYIVAGLGSEMLSALSSRPHLRELYLSGQKIPSQLDESIQFPRLSTLVLNATHDTTLSLLKRAPNLECVKIWRDFARTPRFDPSEWWPVNLWSTIKHLDVTGFSGTAGEALVEAWLTSLKVRKRWRFPGIVSHTVESIGIPIRLGATSSRYTIAATLGSLYKSPLRRKDSLRICWSARPALVHLYHLA